jgi:selenide,water dikinase
MMGRPAARGGEGMKDMAKRRRVMQRSARLGHCICDPRKPCPCALLKERDVCLCAGETLEAPAGPVRLTHLVENAGCASKIDQASLKRILSGLEFPEDPRVLVGAPAGDDAGVFQLDGGPALVQTVDVFTPSVDDPYVFGQIAAANSVSDVYAMGGRPLTALSIIGFPLRTVPDGVMREVLRGGIDKMAEAGVSVIGGHSIKDDELKAGFAVTGLVNPDRILTNGRARPGDRLVLTKPIGTGIIAFAAQIDRAPQGALEAAADSMTALNRAAAELMVECGAHACTDVTGFSLLGHLCEMARRSGVDVEVVWDDVPLLPGVLDCAAAGVLPGGIERNRESCGESVLAGPGVEPAMVDVCLDPQTSGGLLIAIAEDAAGPLVERLRAAGVTDAADIGRVTASGTGRAFVTTRGARPLGAPANTRQEEECCMPEEKSEECCPEVPAAGEAAESSGAEASAARFLGFMHSVNKPGALDAATKRILAVALSVLSRCEPCAKAHIAKAREMGISQAEVDEAAWLAISFGGSPTKMFYDSLSE